MFRKLILCLCFVILAATLMGCAAKQKSTQAARSPTLPVVEVPPSKPLTLAPTPTGVSTAIPEPTNTDVPTAVPELTNTPPPPPATETPLPPLVEYTGPVIARFESGQSLTITSLRMQDADRGWAIGGWGREAIMY